MAVVSITSYPIQFKGRIINFTFHTVNDLVQSWDILYRGLKLNKADPDTREQLGFTLADLQQLNELAEQQVAAREGRTIGSSSALF